MMLLPESIGCQTKNSVPVWEISFRVIGWGVSETLETIQDVAISLGYPPVLDGRSYDGRHCLPCSSGHGKSKLVGIRILAP